MLSLLCPTRRRLDKAKRLLDSFNNTKKLEGTKLWFGIQMEDPSHKDYINYFKEINYKDFIITDRWLPTTQLWNKLASVSNDDIMMLMGDDVVIDTPNFDEIIVNKAKEYPDGIYCMSPQDGRNNDSKACPHPIVSKQWVHALGYFMPPCFMHRYIDLWTSSLARNLNRYVYLPEVKFSHLKSETSGDNTGKVSREWLYNDEYSYSLTKRWWQSDLEVLTKIVEGNK